MTETPDTALERIVRSVADLPGSYRIDIRPVDYTNPRFTLNVNDLRAVGSEEEAEAYEFGKRDGYESAIQDLDLATGGDGEFYASTLPGRGCPDAEAMKARILERFAALQQGGAEQ